MNDGMDVARAQHLFDLKRPAEALAAASKLLAARPDDPAALRLAARCQAALGKDREALHTAHAAVAADPESEHGYRILAQVLRRAKRFQEAAAAAQEAVRLAPDQWHGHFMLAQCLLRLDPEAALASAEHACQLAPQSPDTHYICGAILSSLKRRQEAQAAYRRALRLDPQHAPSLNGLAGLDRSVWNWGGSLRGFNRILSLDPQQSIARSNLEGLILRRLWRLGWLAVVGIQVVSAGAPTNTRATRTLAITVDAVIIAATWASLWNARRDLGLFGWRLIHTDRRALTCQAIIAAAVLLIAATAATPAAVDSAPYLAVWATLSLMSLTVLIQLRRLARETKQRPEAL